MPRALGDLSRKIQIRSRLLSTSIPRNIDTGPLLTVAHAHPLEKVEAIRVWQVRKTYARYLLPLFLWLQILIRSDCMERHRGHISDNFFKL